MAKRTAIVGTGQTYHTSRRRDVNGRELIAEAVAAALEDAALSIRDIDAVVIGNMDHFEGINYMDLWSIDGNGGFMKPTFKVTTGGTTGTTIAIAGFHHVASGMFDRVLAIGWEKNSESDTTAAIITCADPVWERPVLAGAISGLATAASIFLDRSGATEKDAARVAVRDRGNAVNNPHAHLRQAITVEDVMRSPMLANPVKLLDICPRTDGACAVIYASEDAAENITDAPAWVHAVATCHDYTYFGDVKREAKMHTLWNASREAYKKAGIANPLEELDVVEMYTPSSFAGLGWTAAIGLWEIEECAQNIWDGVTDMNGKLPINPSGGVIATNPIGATGLIRTAEVAMQIRGRAGEHQVSDVRLGMATGFGGCSWSDVLILGRNKPS